MNRHFSRQFFSFLLLIIGASGANASCGREEDLCVDPSPWVIAHAATVRYAQPQGDFSQWQFTFAGNHDMRIETVIRETDLAIQGSIMLVSGRAMLTKGLALERGYELDVMDAPVFMYRLVVSLLAHALPDGPEEFQGAQQIDIEETKRALRVATQGSSMRYEPPWRIKGSVERMDEVTVAYSLTLTHSGKQNPEPLVLSGSWRRNATAPVFDAGMELEGWTLYPLSQSSLRQENAAILDYADPAKPHAIRTLGELRIALRETEAKSVK